MLLISGQTRPELKTLRLLVRNGLPLGDDTDSPSLLQDETQRVLSRLEPKRTQFSRLESLLYESLVAEYHAMFGRIEDAVHALEPQPGKGNAAELFIALDKSAEKGAPTLPQEYLADQKLLRQAIWLLMNYIFFRFYEKNSFERGLRHLDQLEIVVSRHLASDGYTPHGTLSRLYYYRSHCLRGLRRFQEVEHDLLCSQEHANLRLKIKLESLAPGTKDGSKTQQIGLDAKLKSEHRDFAVICTARILGFGFGWTELNRGRLTRAKRLLLSADTLLLPTGHQAMKQLVKFLLATIARRLTATGSDEYKREMRALEKQLRIYQQMKSLVGQLRAVQELARGYLDWVDFLTWSPKSGDSKTERNEVLEKARKFTSDFKELSSHADPHWKCRHRFMDVRLACHLDEARNKVNEKLNDLGRLIQRSQREFELEYHVLRGYALNRIGDWTFALDPLQTALKKIENDPLLEAEVRLLLAECFARTGNLVKAAEERAHWVELRRNVDHSYLRDLERYVDLLIDNSQEPFVIGFHEHLRRDERVEELDSWLKRTAQKRLKNPKDENVANILKVSRATVNRIR